ncbi:MAG: DUF503 domain-containing protein [Calditrichaeota bacterium]|nr:DUF503 domain-containing protein [Calditrichota bacterium]
MTVQLHLPQSHSLKERRSVVSSLRERIRKRFNVSVVEDPTDTWQLVMVIMAAAGHSESMLEQQFSQIRELMDQESRAMVLNPRIEYYV